MADVTTAAGHPAAARAAGCSVSGVDDVAFLAGSLVSAVDAAVLELGDRAVTALRIEQLSGRAARHVIAARARHALLLALARCQFCERECPDCRYPIDAGWVHRTVRSPSHILCYVERPQPQPLVDAVQMWINHVAHSRPRVVR